MARWLEDIVKEITLPINGKNVRALTEKIGTTLWVHLDGRTFTYEPEVRDRRGGKNKAGVAGDVTAPMPGKINKVSVATGDQVKAGQLLLVMEAMKMEYTLKSPADGKVTAINCKAGDQVVLGAVLVHVAPT
jgi:acetyl/propionyl-CoA carboxylase alpha subunit